MRVAGAVGDDGRCSRCGMNVGFTSGDVIRAGVGVTENVITDMVDGCCPLSGINHLVKLIPVKT